jgi:5-oxoprolinase (ATP-hydrolysing)
MAVARPEDVAEGFLRIALENMANAIKKISVERGHDVTGYTLCCFGGAGGQHACGVADALGMTTVIVHPFAGVLSAYGMGLADIRAMRERQFDAGLDRLEQAKQRLSELSQEARDEVAGQGISPDRIHVETRAHLKYAGSHQALAVPFGSADDLRAAFEEAHRSRFGFVSPGRDLVFDMLEVEAIGATEAGAPPAPPEGGDPAPADRVQVHLAGGMREAPIYRRDDLPQGTEVGGPAIVTEATGTTMIEPGWRGRIDPLGNLILDRIEAAARETALGTEADPVMLEVFNNLFMNIAEQMGGTLAEHGAFGEHQGAAGFFLRALRRRGQSGGQRPACAGASGLDVGLPCAVADLNAGKIALGDAFMLNSPFKGGTHLPDVTVITPVFDAAGRDSVLSPRAGTTPISAAPRPARCPPTAADIDDEAC